MKPTYEQLEKRINEFKEKLKRVNSDLHLLNRKLDQRVKEKTHELQESEKQLRLAIEGAKEGFWVIDFIDGGMNFTTRSAEILGYSLNELGSTSERWDKLTHPSDWPMVEKALMDHFEGKTPYYEAEYRAKTKSGEWKWILGHGMVTKRDEDGSPLQAIGTHVDITKLKQTENKLRKREKELENKTSHLEEVNIALRVLLRKREEDKTEIEEKIMLNVRDLVMPYINKLENTRLGEKQKTYLSILKSNLNDVISPFSHSLAASHLNFTPKEIQVANLLKEDKISKEIAELLYISESAVEFHRHNIRKKLGLVNKKINLKSYLQSLR